MADTKELYKMVDSLIQGNVDQAKVHFHQYLPTKTQEVLKVSPDQNSKTKKR